MIYGLAAVSAVDVGVVMGIAFGAAVSGYVAGYWARLLESTHQFL